MAWPVEVLLLLVALAGCWASMAALQASWWSRSWPLAVVGLAIVASLVAEVGALNNSWGPTLGDGIGVVTVLLAGVALAALAVYLLLPPPQPVGPAPPRPWGPAVNPDSEA
ncbi:MAG TPA: hypothetical protein VMV23_06355 [Candidatus Nanopelagicaceae bacterium]|nr:hypothetical protein [Candidatus Nanopelagicaceae bacterium]